MTKEAKRLFGVLLGSLVFCGPGVFGQAESQTADLKLEPGQTQSSDAQKTPSKGADQDTTKPDKKSGTEQSAPPAQAADRDDQPESEPARHKSHVHLGTIGVGVGYSHFSGNFFPYYGYGFYPYGYGFYPGFYPPLAYRFYDPFYGPYYPGAYPLNFDYRPDKGEVKLTSNGKGAQVYLNGGFAGTADKLKTMWLEPGAYDLSVSEADGRKFQQRIYVISGKTLKIDAKMATPSDSKRENK